MPETTVNACQRIILLRSLFVAILVLCLVFPCATSALAVTVYDYNDFVTDVRVDGVNDVVTLDFPLENTKIYWALYDGVTNQDLGLVASSTGPVISAGLFEGDYFYLDVYPLGEDEFGYPLLDVSEVPNGSKLSISFTTNLTPGHGTPTHDAIIAYCNDDGDIIKSIQETVGTSHVGEVYTIDFTLDKPDGANCIRFWVQLDNWYALYTDTYTFTLLSCNMELSISSLYKLQREMGKTNEILGEVEKQLEENGQTLEQILQEQEKLPDKIGDEMQGIIDNEKNEASTEGNKFVDQILSALPDPSQDVLLALKGLTDVMTYSGTDAVLPIPAIVLPGIDGLFPETEIWGGTEFDFGEYIQLLPSALLTLVQALFTIAIVLFCVYELKGIISYCLTLKENKGG